MNTSKSILRYRVASKNDQEQLLEDQLLEDKIQQKKLGMTDVVLLLAVFACVFHFLI